MPNVSRTELVEYCLIHPDGSFSGIKCSAVLVQEVRHLRETIKDLKRPSLQSVVMSDIAAPMKKRRR